MNFANKVFAAIFSLLSVFVLVFLAARFPGGALESEGGGFLAQIVGISAGVNPNQVNVLAQSLAEKERELINKEQTLSERESLLAEQTALDELKYYRSTRNTLLFVGGVLFLLIAANFYFDYRRGKRRAVQI